MGSGVVVDAIPLETGIAVVERDRVRLVDRAGAAITTWTSARALAAATTDGERLYVADGAAVTILDPSLSVVGSYFTTFPCAELAVVSCGRVVCTGEGFVLYDESGTGVPLTTFFTSPTDGHLMWVPGVDAVVSGGAGLGFFRIDPDDVPVQTWGGIDLNLVGFSGRPAVHAISREGRMYRVAGCMVGSVWAPSTDCFARDGTLGTVGPDQSILLSDTGPDGELFALVGTPPSWYASPCGGCSVQRIDVPTRTVASSAPVSIPSMTARETRLQHDAWAGRAVLTVNVCATSYPYTCTGHRVELVAYD